VQGGAALDAAVFGAVGELLQFVGDARRRRAEQHRAMRVPLAAEHRLIGHVVQRALRLAAMNREVARRLGQRIASLADTTMGNGLALGKAGVAVAPRNDSRESRGHWRRRSRTN
jgi:hypothetical protein